MLAKKYLRVCFKKIPAETGPAWQSIEGERLQEDFTIPNQSSLAKAHLEFEDDGRMKPSPPCLDEKSGHHGLDKVATNPLRCSSTTLGTPLIEAKHP